MLSRSVSSRSFIISSIFATALLSAGAALAQTPTAVPVARLLRFPSDSTAPTRPRRVTTTKPMVAGPSLAEATEIERRAFDMTNTMRLQSNLAPLVWDPELCRMARSHSEDMVRRGFFAHSTPEGHRLKDRAHAAGIAHFQVLGENIAYNQGFDDPGAFTVGRWMQSSGHRANILSPEFQQSAIGVFIAPDGTIYLTQEFITR